MADIQLPGKSLIQAYQSGGEVSMDAAAAPYAAAKNLGKDLQGLGEQGMDLLVKHKRVANLKEANDMELAANEMFADFQNQSATDQDPASRVTRYQKQLEAFKGQYLTDKLAPEQQALMGQRFAEFSSHSTISVAKGALMDNLREYKTSLNNVITQSVRLRTPETAKRALGEARDSGNISPAEHDEQVMSLDNKIELDDVERAAKASPLATMHDLDAVDENGTPTHWPNLDPNQRIRVQSIAKQHYREAIGDVVNDVQNGMADGSITTLEQLHTRAGSSVPPRVIAQFEEEMGKKFRADEMAKRDTPEYQNAVIGEVTDMLHNYSPEVVDYDERETEMQIKAGSLPAGPSRSNLLKRIADVKKNKLEEYNTAVEQARGGLTEAFRAEYMGKTKVSRSLQESIDRGLLTTDSKSMMALGLNKDQVNLIRAGKTQNDKAAIFREQLGKVPLEKQNFKDLPSPTRLAYEAVRDRKGFAHMVEWESPEDKARATAALGEAVKKLDTWAALEPEKAKNSEEVDKKVGQIISPHGLKNFTRSMVPAMVLPPLTPPEDAPDFLPDPPPITQ
jgi:hypothetical protein